MIVLDTHAWIWWASDPDQLSPTARREIERARKEQGLHIATISSWEVALLVRKKRLRLTMDVEDWIARSEALPYVHFVPLTNGVALKAVSLPEPLHPDPADRIIVATTISLGGRLVTKDKRLRRYRPVQTVW
jgi:PIN domain nuclease of toxin-antitoxin system